MQIGSTALDSPRGGGSNRSPGPPKAPVASRPVRRSPVPSRLARLAALILTALSVLAVSAGSASAANTASIAGTVKGPGNVAVQGICVSANGTAGGFGSAQT